MTPRAVVHSGGRLHLAAFGHIDGVANSYRLDYIGVFRTEEG